MIRLIHTSAHDTGLEPESVHMIATSPPYWGLRKYDGDQGVSWPAVDYSPMPGLDPIQIPAMTCDLGLEPTPEAYIGHLILVMREMWRVLRADGVAWVNLGDSYAGSWGNYAPTGTGGQRPVSEGGERWDRPAYEDSARRPPTSNNEIALKPKDLCQIPARFALAVQADGWWVRSDIIWCLSGGAKVYAQTQKGEMPTMIKDLVRLDPSTVKLWNGEKWTQVLGWSESPRPENPIEITLRSGERIGCTPGHEWPTQRGLIRAEDLQPGDIIQTTTLPEPDQPIRPRHLPDSLGWFVGLYLAEGSKGKGGKVLQFSSHKDERRRLELLQILAEEYGGTCRAHDTSENGMTINIYSPVLAALVDMYIGGNGAKNKHLTTKAWQRSDQFLAELLEGYLSGDGHWDENNERWRIGFTRNYNWAADLRTICARLGYQLRLNTNHAAIGDRKFPTFRGEIRFERSTHHNAKQDGEIVAIGRSKARQFWDIGVEDEPHLFALASGVLTHNSKPNPMPESVTDRPTKAHEYIYLLSKSQRYFYDHVAVREGAAQATLDRNKYGFGGAFKGQFKGTPNEKRWQDGRPIEKPNFGEAGRNLRSVWTQSTRPYPGAHFATWPPDLVRPMIRAGTSARGVCPECGAPWARITNRNGTTPHPAQPQDHLPEAGKRENGTRGNRLANVGQYAGDTTTTGWAATCDHGDLPPIPATVLDPFSGSGTTGRVAIEEGRAYVGVDISATYLEELAPDRLTTQIGLAL